MFIKFVLWLQTRWLKQTKNVQSLFQTCFVNHFRWKCQTEWRCDFKKHRKRWRILWKLFAEKSGWSFETICVEFPASRSDQTVFQGPKLSSVRRVIYQSIGDLFIYNVCFCFGCRLKRKTKRREKSCYQSKQRGGETDFVVAD